jgi:hypothetical protein
MWKDVSQNSVPLCMCVCLYIHTQVCIVRGFHWESGLRAPTGGVSKAGMSRRVPQSFADPIPNGYAQHNTYIHKHPSVP